MEQGLTNAKSISIPMEQKEKALTIPRKSFRSAYVDHLAFSKELTTKKESIVDWWRLINEALFPLAFIWIAIECCL